MLVKKVIEPGVDVNGLPKKTTKYLPTDIVSYDEKHKQYIISVDDTPTTPTEPTEPTTPQTESVTEDTMPVDTPVFE